jgi:hypothetical protein
MADIALTSQQVSIIRSAYTEIGSAFHQLLREDAALEYAAGGGASVDDAVNSRHEALELWNGLSAYTQISFVLHQLPKYAAGGGTSVDDPLYATQKKLEFWHGLVKNLIEIDAAVATNPVLTDEHQAKLREIQTLKMNIRELYEPLPHLSVDALDSGMMGEHSLDGLRHEYVAHLTTSMGSLNYMLRTIMPLLDDQGPERYINPDIGKSRGVD